jgi:hypothetical protein
MERGCYSGIRPEGGEIAVEVMVVVLVRFQKNLNA